MKTSIDSSRRSPRADRTNSACRGLAVVLAGSALLLAASRPLKAYSVLSHEAVVDTAWDPVIKPLLLKRYPTASEAQLKEAHAYAYGGSRIALQQKRFDHR